MVPQGMELWTPRRRERMAGPRDQQQRLAVELLEGQVGHRRGLCEAAQHQVDLALAQLRHQLRVGAAGHAHAQRGRLRMQRRDGRRQQVRRHVRQGADGHLQLVELGLVQRQAQPFTQPAQRHHCVAHQHVGRRRQLDAAPPAQQQTAPDDVLELGDGLGDRRLRERQRLGGTHQVALLGHHHQALQMSQLQAGKIYS